MKGIYTVFVIVFSVWACLPIFPSGTSEAVAEPAVRIRYLSMHDDPDIRISETKILDTFEDENPEVKVDYIVQDYENFEYPMDQYLTSTVDIPDLMTCSAGYGLRSFIRRGLIRNIGDLWEKEEWDDIFSPGWKNLCSAEGNQFFIPNEWYSWGIYYCPSVFKKYGLEEPESWDEFLKICEVFLNEGITPLAMGNLNRWPAAAWFDYLVMRMYGSEYHKDLMDGLVPYSSDELKHLFAEWGRMIDRGYFSGDSARTSWYDAAGFLADESAAMYLMGDFIQDALPPGMADDLDFFRFPLIDPLIPVGEIVPVTGYLISGQAENPESAERLLSFFAADKSRDFQFLDADCPDPVNRVIDSTELSGREKGRVIAGQADYLTQHYDRNTHPEMAEAGLKAFEQFWSSHTYSDIERICDNLEAKRQELDWR